MPAKEAQARIKLNKLLEAAGWRFFNGVKGQANVALGANVNAAIDRLWGSAPPAARLAQTELLRGVTAEVVWLRAAVSPPVICTRSTC
jgi:hypothetical protein